MLPRGFTYMEIVVSLVLVAAILIVIVGLFPMGMVSLRKADAMQAATLYGCEVVEQACGPTFDPAAHPGDTFEATVDTWKLTVRRDVVRMDADERSRFYDVAVTVSWAPDIAPVRLRTRVYRR